ncbi:MAG TPA: hypothetical protein DEB23_08645 [Chitinophagaceae bacterium]|nr:hypothetical protein [Chitinophagaceae bacterium]
MAQTSRFEGQQIVNSINLFVDSERASVVGDTQSRGDNIHLGFEGNTIECKDGEVIRLSLVDFHMPNNQYNIDARNSQATLICSVNGTAMAAGVVHTFVSRGNYYDTDDIAVNFANNLAARLLALTGFPGGVTLSTIVNNNLSAQTTTTTGFTSISGILGKPEKKLLDVTITFSGAHTITNLKISCQSANGELYLVLGGERGDNSTTLANSFKITTTSTSITIQGYYPMQLITEPHVYLRCTLGQNGLESSILGSDETIYNNDIVASNILAKIARTSESFSYAGNQSGEFFVTLQQRKLNSIGLFLTDSKSRPIGRAKNAGTGTSAGLEGTATSDIIPYESENQSRLGNLYFTATIRIDIVKVYNPNILQSEPPAMPPFPSRASGVITFGSPTGFR